MLDAGVNTTQAGLTLAEPLSLRQNIQHRIDTRLQQIKEDQELLELLDNTPGIERILTLLGKSGRF